MFSYQKKALLSWSLHLEIRYLFYQIRKAARGWLCKLESSILEVFAYAVFRDWEWPFTTEYEIRRSF